MSQRSPAPKVTANLPSLRSQPLRDNMSPGTASAPGRAADVTEDCKMNRRGIEEAIELIAAQWRTTAYRGPLITALTALDWQARILEDDEPVDEELIDKIARLRSQIWLSTPI